MCRRRRSVRQMVGRGRRQLEITAGKIGRQILLAWHIGQRAKQVPGTSPLPLLLPQHSNFYTLMRTHRICQRQPD